MRMKKKIALILAAVVLVWAIAEVLNIKNEPPFGTESADTPEEYLKVNSYVEKSLKDDFAKTLPKSIPTNLAEKSYCYRYSCGVQEIASFYINLKLKYKSEADFTAEYDRLQSADPKRTMHDGKAVHLFYGDDREALEGYFDNESYDGTVWRFNIVTVNSDELTVEYTVAGIPDGAERFDALTQRLLQMKALLE